MICADGKADAAPRGMLESLGITNPLYVGRNKFDYLIEVGSEDELRALDPNHSELRKISVRGVSVTTRGTRHAPGGWP